MFNFRPDRARIGLAVEADEPTGFRVGADGLPLPALASRPGSPSFPGNADAGAPLAVSDLLLQTGGPIEPNAMIGLPDRFGGNPYWPAERDQGMVSQIVPIGYGSLLPSAPRPEVMQTMPPWRTDAQVNLGEQSTSDVVVPDTGVPLAKLPILAQYKPESASPPSPPPSPCRDLLPS